MTNWLRRFRARSTSRRDPGVVHAPPAAPAGWRKGAQALDHGTPLGPSLAAALREELVARATPASLRWTIPELSRLHVHRDGLPDWWQAGGNLVLVGEGADRPDVAAAMLGVQVTDSMLIVGADVRSHRFAFAGGNNLIVVGDACRFPTTDLCAVLGGTIMVGEETSSTFLGQLDSRNGGVILSGADGMWAAGVRLITDDMHAIVDMGTGRRLNHRGGRIVIGRHVWLGEHVMVMGGAVIGADTVVGASSLVKGKALPPNSVCAGSPARVRRTGTTWSREDRA